MMYLLWTTRNRSCTLSTNLLLQRARRRSGVDVFWVGWLCDGAVHVCACFDQLAFAPVPLGQHLCRGRTAQNARVNQAGESHAGDVTARTKDAFEIPNGLGSGDSVSISVLSLQRCFSQGSPDLRLGVYLVQEPASVLLCKHTCEAPWLFFHRLHILDLDHQYITRLCGFNVKGSCQIVDLGQVDVSHVVGRVIVSNLPTSPVDAFDLNDLVVFNGAV